MKWKRRLIPVAASIVVVASSSGALAAPFKDQLVQPPSIGQPERGSIAGSLSRLAFGPSALARGTYSLPMPIEVPSERGAILTGIIPSYSAENGVGEWGVGWQNDLTIRRHRVVGEIDFSDDDDFTTPWGRLVRGDDGAYYPAGLRTMARMVLAGDGWEVTTAEGTVYRFDEDDANITADGTYSWNLSRIDTLLGDSTTLSWTRNDSGRAFLSEVLWGGRFDGTQYRMTLAYEPLTTPYATFISGEKAVLDRRVSRVTTAVWDGGYVERWRHDLTYQASPTGPAFYLASITKRYASGATEPPVTYTYDFSTDQLASASFEDAPQLDTYLATYGSGAIQPDRAAMTDLERNGLTDMEVYLDNTLVRQTDEGYVFEPLPALTGAENLLCRPAPSATNKPRFLARMHGDADEPNVVVTKLSSTGTSTRLVVCDRAGMTELDQTIAGAWAIGANTRLADVDQDQRPDLVRVSYGSAQVLANTSTAPEAISFAAGVTSSLTPRVTPTSSWILDFNGDNRPDLMVRHASGVVVWRGIGGGAFEPAGTSFVFTTASGGPLAGLSTYEFSHGDFNNDGLSDLILTKGQTVLLFTNRGSSFVETPVAAFASIPWGVSYPVVVDLSGSGNEQIVMADGVQAKVLQLSRPSTGLLVSADDGKGTVIDLGYGRVRPAPGVNQLYSIVTSMSVTSSGYDTVTYDYDYGAPVWHTEGKYLVGFEDAHKTSPFLEETVAFFNDDDIAGAVTGTLEEDARTPGVLRFSDRQTELASFHGVPWLRLVSEESGYRNLDASEKASTRVDYLAYGQNGVCPTVIETTGPDGVNRQETTLTEVSGLDPELVCLTGSLRVTGTHADASLDYDYRVDLARDDLGRLVRAEQIGPTGAMVLQEVAYDANNRIASVTAPGKGTTTYSYDASGQIATIAAPDGVVESVESRAALNDAVAHARTTRGDTTWDKFYDYDGMERLHASWDNVAGGTAASPLSQVDYVFATATSPGRIVERQLVDAASSTITEMADIMAADGTVLATASLQPGGWSLGGIRQTVRNDRETRTYAKDLVPSLGGLTNTSLYAGATLLGVTAQTGNGGDFSSTSTVQTGVVSEGQVSRTLSGNQMILTATENGTYTTTSGLDANGKARFFQDQNGVQSFYRYDALGRLRRVQTSSGEHTVDFDAYGRPSRVARAGLRSIEYTYDDASNLLATRRERGADGTLDRTEAFTYDAAGRSVSTVETKASSGETRTVQNTWDGQIPGAPTVPGQVGFPTSVITDELVKVTTYEPDGKIATTRVDLDGWRAVSQDFTYHASGAPRIVSTTITDDAGSTLLSTEKQFAYDAYGRLSRCEVDGAEIYTIGYDATGRPSVVHFADGDVTFSYDPTTRERSGYAATGSVSGAVSWDRNARGLTSRETLTVGGDTVHRDYAYDGRRYLASATDEDGVATYSYDAAGLIDGASDALGDRDIVRSAGAISTGDASYTLDGLGRVVSRGDLSVTYGPSGNIEHATRGGVTFRFAYDETGKRILKYEGAVPVAGYVAGGYLGADGFVEPMIIDGVLMGVFENGVFRRVLFDRRGTTLADDDGDIALASPYGTRLSHGELAEAIDYVQKGYDPDLGLVRMGVRDYDPELGQFWTPDPLFMADVEKCASSPAECNLYGYAKNNPIDFVDPAGTESEFDQKPGESQETKDERLADAHSMQESYRIVEVWSGDDKKTHQWRNPYEKKDGFNATIPSGQGNAKTAQVTIKADHVFVSRSTVNMGLYSLPLVVYSYVETELRVSIKNGHPTNATVARQYVTHLATYEGGGYIKLGAVSPKWAGVMKGADSYAALVDTNKIGTASATPYIDKDTVGMVVTFGVGGATYTNNSGSLSVSAGVEGKGANAGVQYTFPTTSTSANGQNSLRQMQVNVNLFPKANAWNK